MTKNTSCIIKKRANQVTEKCDLVKLFSSQLADLNRWINIGAHTRYDVMLKSWGYHFIPSLR